MHSSKVAVLALVVALIATPVMAQEAVTNTWIGMTGLVIIPSAETTPQSELIASFNWTDTDRDSTEVWSAIVGLTPEFEVGVAHVDRGGSSETIGNLKYQLNLPQLTRTADLAIGVWDIADDVDRALFIVLSDEFGQARNAQWSLGLANSDGGMLDGLFAGVEFAATEQGVIQIDYDSEDLNAAYRHQVSDQLTVGAGVIDSDLALNIAYDTGF